MHAGFSRRRKRPGYYHSRLWRFRLLKRGPKVPPDNSPAVNGRGWTGLRDVSIRLVRCHMRDTYINLPVHIVFTVKKRAAVLSADINPELWKYIGGIARKHKMSALAVGGIEDHVHILLSLPSTLSLARAVNLVKGGSSWWLSRSYPELKEFRWQNGYGAVAVSPENVARVRGYINSQSEHHERIGYEMEFRSFFGLL